MAGPDATRVAESNRGQMNAWDGEAGAYWAAHADRFDAAMAGYQGPFLEAAAIASDDAVLDIGCGNGGTTIDAARIATAGSALGVDLSAAMLHQARLRAATSGISNVEFLRADAQVHPFAAASFDVAISRTGAMFFGDMAAAFANIGRALRSGGRLVLLTWQPPSENEWFSGTTAALDAGRGLEGPPVGAQGPFALADPDHVRGILTASGYREVEIEGISRPEWFGSDAADAQAFVLGSLGWLLDGLDERARARARDELLAWLAAHETDDGVLLGSAAWLVRATKA